MTLTDILGYLPHGLVGVSDSGDIAPIDIYTLARHGIKLDGHKPVLRPMDDLATEITEKGYNDGKPFVPIVELAKEWGGEPICDYRILPCNGLYVGIEILTPNRIFSWWMRDRYFDAWWSGQNDIERGDHIELCDTHKAYDLLHAWHFDYRGLIEQGSAVNVHYLEKNPYE